MWTWGCLGSGALCPSASGAVICILGSLMELVILQYFVIAQTLSVLLSGAVPGYSRRYCKSWEWEELCSMLKLIANLPPTDLFKPREKPCRNAGDWFFYDFSVTGDIAFFRVSCRAQKPWAQVRGSAEAVSFHLSASACAFWFQLC